MKPFLLPIVRGFCVVLFFCSEASYAEAVPNDRGDTAALALMEDARAAIVSTLKGRDKKIVESVVLYAPWTNQGLNGVVAYIDPPSQEPRVSMSVSSHYVLYQLSQALLVATNVLKTNQDAYLLGYVRYLAYLATFRNKPMSAVSYAEYYGGKNVQKALDDGGPLFEAQAKGAYAVFLMFIMGHELAHHINDDVSSSVLPEEQRKREANADKWAAERLQDLGVNPDLVVMSMLVFNELENASLKNELVRDHPAALRRSATILEHSIARLKDMRPKIEAALVKSSAAIDFDTYERGLRKGQDKVKAELEYQLRLDNEPGFMLNEAKTGDSRAQKRLVHAYLKGTQKGIAIDKKKAEFWSKVVFLRNLPYEYFDNAFSAYTAGTLMASSDKKMACNMIALAQNMGLEVADFQMKIFQEDGVCTP